MNQEIKSRIASFSKYFIYAISCFTVLLMISVFGFIIYESIYFFQHYSFAKFLTGRLWSSKQHQFGIAQIILANFFVLLIALAIALPLTIFTSCFIVEYLSWKWKRRVINVIQILAGIPSVVFGLFALSVLGSIIMKLGSVSSASLLTTSITLAFMGLPIMVSLSVNALESVPNSLRYSAIAMGLTKEYATFKIVFRSVRMKVIGAIMLGIARIIGETMAVLMICGNNTTGPNMHHGLSGFLFSTVATLASVIGLEALESVTPLHTSALYALGVILIVLVFLINVVVMGVQYQKRKKTTKKVTTAFFGTYYRRQFHRRFGSDHHSPSQVVALNSEIVNLIAVKKDRTTKIHKINSFMLKIFLKLSTLLVVFFVLTILVSVFWNGLVKMHWPDLMSTSQYHKGSGILATFFVTILLVVLSLLIVMPFAMVLGIYMSEYASKTSVVSKSLRFLTTVFTATPSIVYGLFGLEFVIGVLHLPVSILAAAITLSFVILPMLTNNIEVALQNVPQEYRVASYALGLTKTQTLRKIVFRNGLPGIFTAIILAITRVISESAPVYLTLGTAVLVPSQGFMSPGASMAVRILMLWKNGVSPTAFRMMYEIAFIIIVLMLLLNVLFQSINQRLHHNYVKQSWREKWDETKSDVCNMFVKTRAFVGGIFVKKYRK